MSSENVNNRYQKMDPVEHVLKLPDTYVGSTEKHCESIPVIVEETIHNENSEPKTRFKIQKKNISFVPYI